MSSREGFTSVSSWRLRVLLCLPSVEMPSGGRAGKDQVQPAFFASSSHRSFQFRSTAAKSGSRGSSSSEYSLRPRCHVSHSVLSRQIQALETEPEARLLDCTLWLVQMVLRGNLDAAIVELPIRRRGLRMLSLYSEPLTAVLPGKYASSRKETTKLADLIRMPLTLIGTAIKDDLQAKL